MTAPAATFVVISTLEVVSALMSTAFAQAPDQPGAGGTAPTVSGSKILGAQGADEWLASQLRGTAVVGSDNQRIGEIVDVLLDRNGQARAFIVGIGGVMGLGAKEIAIDLAQFHDVPAASTKGAKVQLKVSLTREELDAARQFQPLPVPDATTGKAPR
jgi:sporulation protein YlmC with PRC-barrel domain